MDSKTTSTSGSYTINMTNHGRYGWVCPLCGRANAPWLGQCPCQPLTTWTRSSPISPSEWDPGKPYCTINSDTKDGVTWSNYRAIDE